MAPAPAPVHPREARGRRRPWPRLAAPLALALLLLFGAAGAAAAPGTLRVLDLAPTRGTQVTVAAPGGGSFSADPGGALVRVTDAAGRATETLAWCIDADRLIDTGTDYPVDLRSSAEDPAVAGARGPEAAWLISRAGALIAAAPSPGFEAAAIQLAVWQLTGEAADLAAVTSDAALNARVAALRALAAGRAPGAALALSAPATVAPGASALVTVTGTPGTEVALEVAAGGASLSAAALTIGPGGSAQVTVTPSSAGQVVVVARAEGGILWRASPPAGGDAPQDMAYVVPVPLVASATISAAVPAPAVAGAPVAPPPPAPRPAAAPAALRLVKAAPPTARRGRLVTYTLTVTNVSRRTARDVVVRDPLPPGTFLPRRPARARLAAGAVVWRLGSLAPRARVILRLRLRTLPAAPALVRNVARASASNAATVRAGAVTRLTRPRRVVAPVVVAPAVTG